MISTAKSGKKLCDINTIVLDEDDNRLKFKYSYGCLRSSRNLVDKNILIKVLVGLFPDRYNSDMTILLDDEYNIYFVKDTKEYITIMGLLFYNSNFKDSAKQLIEEFGDINIVWDAAEASSIHLKWE